MLGKNILVIFKAFAATYFKKSKDRL